MGGAFGCLTLVGGASGYLTLVGWASGCLVGGASDVLKHEHLRAEHVNENHFQPPQSSRRWDWSDTQFSIFFGSHVSSRTTRVALRKTVAKAAQLIY